MNLPSLLTLNLAAIAVLFTAVWLASLARRDVSIIDLFWGLGFVMLAWLSWATGKDKSNLGLARTLMVSVWGLRLSLYLTWRNWGHPEDHRYRAMRTAHGSRFPWVSLVTVFALQGGLMWVIALPIQIGSSMPSYWSALRVVGLLLASLGIAFESIGDFQLAHFKADPANRGKLMNRGLWRYTRHPNYFGDFLVWWGFYLAFLQADSWWITAIGPILMTWLLLRVSGVQLLESSLKSRLEGYEEYVRTTSAFFPLPPK